MFYIKATPSYNGNYGNPVSKSFPNSIALQGDLLSSYIAAKGFILPVIENGQVESLIINKEALAVYEASHQQDISDMKVAKIAITKTDLATYLAEHPLTWIDGNKYTVTADKQSLLTSQLALYQTAMAAGQSYELKWNATGSEGIIWKYEDLVALALAINQYVQPLVAYQQAKEIEIMSCKTLQELESIIVDYDLIASIM